MKFHVFQLQQASWKCKLRDTFKFLRCPSLPESSTNSTPSKRLRPNDSEDESIDYKVEILKEEMKKKKVNRKIATILSLSWETFSGRRSWIHAEQPPVSDILVKFPSLTLRKVVRRIIIVNVCHQFLVVEQHQSKKEQLFLSF